MRILVLLTDAFGGRGGIAKFNRDLLKALCSYPDCEKVVAIPRVTSEFQGAIPQKLRYVASGNNGKIQYIWAVLKEIITRSGFDLILCNHIRLMPLAFLAHKLVKAPLVLVIYGIESWFPPKKLFVKQLTRKINKYISISRLTEDRFLEWSRLNRESGFILPCSVDLKLFYPSLPKESLVRKYGLCKKKVILTVCRLASNERRKGVDEVLNILPEILAIEPNIIYMIVGNGDDAERLVKKAERLGLKEHVIFTGYVKEEKKADYYRLAHVYVMPSRGEGFGIVFLEAMACGIPVIASTADGSREAVEIEKKALLAEPGNQEQLKNFIFQALCQPRGKVPEGLEYFSIYNFEKKTHSILQKILS